MRDLPKYKFNKTLYRRTNVRLYLSYMYDPKTSMKSRFYSEYVKNLSLYTQRCYGCHYIEDLSCFIDFIKRVGEKR